MENSVMVDGQLRIFDTTLRDGEQAPGFSLLPGEKLEMAQQLERLGVDVIEAGFAIASDAEANAIRLVASNVKTPIVASLARTSRADVERAAWAIRPAARGRIHTFISTSDLHLSVKLRIDRTQCIEAATDAVRFARRHTADVQFSAEDATRSDVDFLCQVVEAVIRAGATTINLPDTVGYSTPDEIREMFTQIRTRVPGADQVVLSTHCHNDLGLAVANSIAAIEAGARQVECTVNGIGERAGNAALEEIVMALRVRPDRLPYQTRVESRQLFPSSRLIERLTGQCVQANKAVVGNNAFAHEAGIHQDGVFKDRRTYEIMRPEDVGAPSNRIVLGRHSGRHAVERRCAELGIEVGRDQLTAIYQFLMAVADKRKTITDADVHAAAGSTRRRRDSATAPSVANRAKTASDVSELHEAGYGHGV
jgi:2-isopropylmalate synthase